MVRRGFGQDQMMSKSLMKDLGSNQPTEMLGELAFREESVGDPYFIMVNFKIIDYMCLSLMLINVCVEKIY
jgi:hypothetical protein